MFSEFPATTRRRFLTASATAGALGFATSVSADTLGLAGEHSGGGGGSPAPAAAGPAVRPFHFKASDAELLDLRRRVSATRWPDKETVNDDSQGVRLGTMRKVADYWVNGYDWRKFEARFDTLPQFITEIDGVDIHFIHVKSRHANALPVIITHGWPGSIIEQLKVIDPLTNPTAHGGTAADAFDVVIPSLPGHGFSGKPTVTGWDPIRIAKAWVVLMKRLGYTRFTAQGGDWGNAVTEQMALLGAPELVGIHTNMPATVPPEIDKAALADQPEPAGLSPDEKRAYEQLAYFYRTGLSYALEMSHRPQTLYGVADSPVGLAAWMMDHDARSYELIARVFDGQSEGLTRDDIVDNITLYWLTNTGVSSARLYWESKLAFFAPKGIPIPAAVSAYPDELYTAPKSWAEKAYPKLVHYGRLEKGGHFAAWEQPASFTAELRESFRSLR
jgi:pimeloyl-ACP methyl ester carboxylesterase